MDLTSSSFVKEGRGGEERRNAVGPSMEAVPMKVRAR
jgi:hypothetical protein